MLRLLLLTSLLIGFSTLLAPAAATSYELTGIVWRTMPIYYCVNPSGGPVGADGRELMSPDAFVDLVQLSFKKWQVAASSSLRFISYGRCSNNPLIQDRVNTVGWRDFKDQPIIGTSYVDVSAGHFLHGGALYEITEGDIVLNSRVDFYTDLNYYLSTILPHTILHEIGHLLGLGHSKVGCAVMAEGRNFPLELCQDDIDGVARLFP